MIVSVTALALGVLSFALAVLLLVKKKLSRTWGISMLVCALILGAAGGVGVAQQVNRRTEDRSCVYLALRYLEQWQTDPAALYLKRVTDQTSYPAVAAQTLLEQVRGNNTVAQLRLGVLENIQNGSQEQKRGLTALKTWNQDGSQSYDALQAAAAVLRELVPLSDSRKQRLDQTFAMETGGVTGEEDLGTAEMLRLQINQSLSRHDWSGALNGAVRLVEEDASVSNRLLLAEVIADATYGGGSLYTSQFSVSQEPPEKDSQALEAEKLAARRQALLDRLVLLQQDLLVTPEEQQETLTDQISQLTEEADELQRQAENIFALRALNSISDIHSLEAQVVRARLYYAMRSYNEAIDTLCRSAGSIQAGLSSNQPLVNALKMVRRAYDTDGEIGVDSPEFREELQVLFGSVHPELIQLGLTPLASAFADQIISDQKTYGSGLFVVGLDASAYPTIRVQLGGQEEVINAIAQKKPMIINDTHMKVSSYQVDYGDEEDRLNSICFVVDTSGSMGGSPIRDARDALNRFLDETSGNTELALVKFESWAETLVNLTTSVGSLKSGVNSLVDGGGTDITAGIQEGISALASANGARTMIVMTDGQSSIDFNVVQSAADEGITIFTIGFGSVNDQLLQDIADMTGGQYLRADSSTELSNVYSSLRGIIGNTITVTYTVENQEDEERYFFLMDESRNRSVRRTYQVGAGEEAPALPAVTLTSQTVVQTRENLDRMAQWQETDFQADYSGTGLDQVTAAQVGGYDCTIDSQGESYLRLRVPVEIADGVYPITLKTQDGGTFSFTDMLAVGGELRCWNYEAGNVQISASQALQLNGDTLVLSGGLRLQETAAPGAVSTLDLRLDGILIFTGVQLPAVETREDGSVWQDVPEQMELGDSGAAQGRGTLSINYNDRAYSDYAGTTLLQGPLVLEYDTAQSRVAAGEEDMMA